jgi:hypothetical protein
MPAKAGTFKNKKVINSQTRPPTMLASHVECKNPNSISAQTRNSGAKAPENMATTDKFWISTEKTKK